MYKELYEGLVSRSLTTFTQGNDDITHIGYCAFMSYQQLVSVCFPNVTAVSSRAFYGCSGLVSADIPNAITLSAEVFSSCSALASVNLRSVQTVGTFTFGGTSSLKNISLPSLKTVASQAFQYSGVEFCSIPVATSIESSGFRSCAKLVTVDLSLGTSVCTLASSGFTGCTALAHIVVPDALVDSYKAATVWVDYASLIIGRSDAIDAGYIEGGGG